MMRDVPQQTLDRPGIAVPANAVVKAGTTKGLDQTELALGQMRLKDGALKPLTQDTGALQLKDARGAAAGRGDSAAAPAGSVRYATLASIEPQQHNDDQSAGKPAGLIVDTESLRIQEVKGPDHLDAHRKGAKGLQEYVQDGTIKPVTGDQVVYRLKEAGAPGGTAAGSSSSSGREEPQVAVLGSPEVPVGLSSALGYMQLGQVARVKVPQHLMEQAAADDTGEITALPESHSAPAAAATSPRAAHDTPANRPTQQQYPAHAAATHTGPQQQQHAAAAAPVTVVAGTSVGHVQQPHFSELQTMWRQRSLDEKQPGSRTQQQQQQQQGAAHRSTSPDIHMPRTAAQPAARHPKASRAGLATPAAAAVTTAAAPPTLAVVSSHHLESIPSDEAIALPGDASDRSSWLGGSRGSPRGSYSSNEDAGASRVKSSSSSSQPAGHLTAAGGNVLSPGTGSSNTVGSVPGRQSPSGWSSANHSQTGVHSAGSATQSSADTVSFKLWMDPSSSDAAARGAAHPAAAAAAPGAERSSTPQQQPLHGAKDDQQQQQQQQHTGARPAGAADGAAGSGEAAGGGDKQQQAGEGGDGRGSVGADAVEYELEVLAIVPGRGKLSGQPLLSDAARHQQAPLDVKGLTHDVAPNLQPPKHLHGCSGWVRRHLSLNLRAPWSAGKRGLGWLGLRGNKKQQQK